MSDERRETAGDDAAGVGRDAGFDAGREGRGQPAWGEHAGAGREGGGQPGWGDDAAGGQPGWGDDVGGGPERGHADQAHTVPRPPGEAPATDPNLVAIQRANLPDELAQWLHEVAAQVDPRLDRIAPDWRNRDQAGAARACVFGLLLGYLGRTYPHVRGELADVAEGHPSFSTLESGNRLATLEQIVADFGRVNAWLGPLVDVDDPQRMRAIVE